MKRKRLFIGGAAFLLCLYFIFVLEVMLFFEVHPGARFLLIVTMSGVAALAAAVLYWAIPERKPRKKRAAVPAKAHHPEAAERKEKPPAPEKGHPETVPAHFEPAPRIPIDVPHMDPGFVRPKVVHPDEYLRPADILQHALPAGVLPPVSSAVEEVPPAPPEAASGEPPVAPGGRMRRMSLKEPIIVRSSDAEALRRELLDLKGEMLSLIARAHGHLAVVDETMLKHLNRNTHTSIEAVLNIRRIVEALERRLTEANALLAAEESFDIAAAQHLVYDDLMVDHDATKDLLGAAAMQPMKRSDWKPMLASLFRHISRRRTIFRGRKFTFTDIPLR